MRLDYVKSFLNPVNVCFRCTSTLFFFSFCGFPPEPTSSLTNIKADLHRYYGHFADNAKFLFRLKCNGLQYVSDILQRCCNLFLPFFSRT